MLSDSERATLREIQHQLGDDPEFEQFFRTRVAPTTQRTWRRTAYVCAIGLSMLLVVIMVFVGAFGAAVPFVATAAALWAANHIEGREGQQEHTD